MHRSNKSLGQKFLHLLTVIRGPLFFILITSLFGLTQFATLPPVSTPQTTSGQKPVPAEVSLGRNDTLLQPLNDTPTTIYLPIIYNNPPVKAQATCNPTGGSGGLKPGTYQTKVAGLNATVIVGKGYTPGQATYLSFYLHGNEGNYTKFQSSTNSVNKLVNKYGWIFVAPQSPKGTSWSNKWEESLNEAFADVLDAMFAKYNVCRRTVIGSAVSGGSIFWTGYFFPYRGGAYQAHVSLLCGALRGRKDAPDKVKQLAQNSQVVANSTFDYIYGTKDYLYDHIQTSIKIYKDAGFRVQQTVLKGAGHCDEWASQGFGVTSDRISSDWEARIRELNLE